MPAHLVPIDDNIIRALTLYIENARNSEGATLAAEAAEFAGRDPIRGLIQIWSEDGLRRSIGLLPAADSDAAKQITTIVPHPEDACEGTDPAHARLLEAEDLISWAKALLRAAHKASDARSAAPDNISLNLDKALAVISTFIAEDDDAAWPNARGR